MIDVGGYTLTVDRAATTAAYARGVDGPEACACWYCRNWIEGRERLLPPAVRELLDTLGIPANGEIEVWEVRGDEQPHGYGGWYMAVGQVLQAPEAPAHQFVLGDWRLSFSSGVTYPVEAFNEMPTFELHFFTWAGDYIDGNPDVA